MRAMSGGARLEVVSEAAVKAVVTWPLVIGAVRDAFRSSAEGGRVFPVAFGRGSAGADHAWGMKSGLVAGDAPLLGVKVGSYWPTNRGRGLAAHGSTTLLLDDATGFPRALLNAHYLNGMRTAAANAVAVDVLSPPRSSRLVVFGAGGQAAFEARAVCQVDRHQVPRTDSHALHREELVGARAQRQQAERTAPEEGGCQCRQGCWHDKVTQTRSDFISGVRLPSSPFPSTYIHSITPTAGDVP